MTLFEQPNFADLLHPTPIRRIDFEATRVSLSLAFAGGTSGGLFNEALESACLAPSTWEPSGFANDIFLKRFVVECFKAQIRGHQPLFCTNYLLKLLTHPPSDTAVVHYRRAVLAELRDVHALRRALETLYLSLVRLRALLENAGGARNWDANRRQLDILMVTREIIDGLAQGFLSASSGLRSLRAFGLRVQGSEPYRSLCDLIRYDSELATVNLQLGVGADGRVRGFELISVSESTQNPFVSSVGRRWLAKLELLVRGYRFGDAEVMARLIDAVFVGLEPELVPLVQLLGDLEFYLGALGFQDAAQNAGLSVCLPELVEPCEPRLLLGLFNPLLLMSGVTTVPCDVVSDRITSTVLITGPNSGGKTRLLQSLALAQLLAQSGSFIPARSGALSLTPGLVVSLVQETRADQSEGRLGMELLRIRELFERLPPGAMVLLDELCSGTNPSEGEQIFELVVDMLTRLRPQAFITTHFLTLAARLERERTIPSLGYLQVELGLDRHPTYQFTPGVAKTSLAGQAAERLGVTGEHLLRLIERSIQRASGESDSARG